MDVGDRPARNDVEGLTLDTATHQIVRVILDATS